MQIRGEVKMNSGDIKSIQATLTIKNSSANSFRIFFSKDSSGWLPIILIVSKGDFNVLDYFEEVFDSVSDFLKSFNLDINECKIYLDLMEYLGIRASYLFKWEPKKSNSISANLVPVQIFQLDLTDLEVIKLYYNDKLSIFTDSLLSNEEKAELIASVLSSSVFDEVSVDGVQTSIKFKLLDAIKKGSSFNWPIHMKN